MAPVLFRWHMRGCLATKHHLLWRLLEDINTLYMVVRHVFRDLWRSVVGGYLFFSFLFSLFSSSFAPTLVKFQNNPFNFSPLTFGHYTFNYYFFIFWISYKIIDAFQFYPLIVFLFINYLSNYKCF
jgi:hypothetical protein